MPEETIKCPKCGFEIPLTEALSKQVTERLTREFEARGRKREEELKRREEEIAKKAGEVDRAVAEKLAAEREKFKGEAVREARERIEVELKALREENTEKTRRIEEAGRIELELRKRERALEEEKKSIELKVARTMDAEREKIRRETLEAFSEEHRFKDLEKEKKISDMLRQIEDLKRKAEQGSVQTQGEVQELDLEEALKTRFPYDEILDVPKGVRGADIIEKVNTAGGGYCGTIVWESKRTKNWNAEWIEKLKGDQREIKAEVAVLVTETLPKEISSFGNVDGVWVTGRAYALSLAEALRFGLKEVARSKISMVGRGEKVEEIYRYLSGSGFRHRVEAILEAFGAMRSELEHEKRAITRLWAKREKQIEKVLNSTSGMYGDLEGILGTALPPIKTLELEAGGETGEEEGAGEGGEGPLFGKGNPST